MLVTNYSDQPHNYRVPGDNSQRYFWGPGESLDVPSGVANLMLRQHPDKFRVAVSETPAAPVVEPVYETAEAGPEVTTEMRPARRTRRRRTTE